MFVWLAPRRTKHFSGQRSQQGGRDRQASRQANPEATEPVNGEVVIHDSCVYARYENICDQPRDLLRAAGVRITVCNLGMDLMDIGREELIDYPHLTYAGVATFIEMCSQLKQCWFM